MGHAQESTAEGHLRPGPWFPRRADTEGLRKEQVTSPEEEAFALSRVKASDSAQGGVSEGCPLKALRRERAVTPANLRAPAPIYEGLSCPHFLSFFPVLQPRRGQKQAPWQKERSSPPYPSSLPQLQAFCLEQAWAGEARNFNRLKVLL